MNISDWPLGKIMQLPDCCFGSRFCISFSGVDLQNALADVISELALPDKCVLWELATWSRYSINTVATSQVSFTLILTDQLPAVGDWDARLQPLLAGEDERVDVRHAIRGNITLSKLRTVIPAQGRRVALRVYNDFDVKCEWAVRLVFSGMPTEVPDWLLSV